MQHPDWPNVILGDDPNKGAVSVDYKSRGAYWAAYAFDGWETIESGILFKDEALGYIDLDIREGEIVVPVVRPIPALKSPGFPLDDMYFMRLLSAFQREAYLYLRRHRAPIRGLAAKILRPQ